MVETMEKELIPQSEVLARGWTKSMIEKFLPAPVERKNPHYRSAPPMKLYYVADVEAAEQTAAFQEAKEKADRRRNSSKKAVETKKKNLTAELDAAVASAKVTVIPLRELRTRAIEARRDWADYHGDYDSTPECAPDSVQMRWMVNYVRHNLVKYDMTLYGAKGKTGISEAYPGFRNAILRKIAGAYPDLAEECERQMI